MPPLDRGSSLSRPLSLALLLWGCGGVDPSAQEGFETGSCIQGQCLSGLQCVSGVCVDAGSGGDDGTGEPPATSGIDPSVGDPDTGPGVDDTTTGAPPTDDSSTSGGEPTDCPSTNDGVCDEPEGTGLCPEGTDVVDCAAPACPTTNDGVCDEPEGTGTCPEGTDADDCAPPACGGDPAAFPAACDQWTQNCAAGEKCNAWAQSGGPSWDATGCFPLDCDPAGVGETCTVVGSGVSGIDDCEQDSMCWNVDDALQGYCVALCSGTPANPSCASADATCVITNGGVLSICLPECNPLAQDCPTDNDTCAPVNDVFACAPDASGAAGAYGDPCAYINACDPGNACLGPAAFTNCAGATGCCSTFCNLADGGADAMCAALDPGQSCVPWFVEGQEPPGYENVGTCSIPV